MMKYRLASVSVLCIVLALLCSCRQKKDSSNRIPVNLNKTLTNEMSDTSSLYKLDRDVLRFMQRWNIHGMQLCVMRNDSLLYAKGYGESDEGTQMGPGNILRVASVSKLITATGIMVLRDRHKIELSDKVFGPEGILCDTVFTNAIKDKRYFDITVENLLRHEGGFSTRGGDPLFQTRFVMMRNHLGKAPDHETLVKCEVVRRLKFVPGSRADYSNFGYLLLSMIIEKITGQDYEEWMRRNVLLPAGCYDMHIAYNYYKQRYPNESRYYVQSNEELVEEYNNSGRMVERCYGGSDVRGLSGAGGWVCSAAELARLVASIDGKPQVPDIISRDAVQEMTCYYDDNTYALGWNDTKPDVGWVRTGTLSSTCALIKYFPDGQCWIMVTNTGTWKGPRFARYTKALCSESRARYSALLPTRDFFYED